MVHSREGASSENQYMKYFKAMNTHNAYVTLTGESSAESSAG